MAAVSLMTTSTIAPHGGRHGEAEGPGGGPRPKKAPPLGQLHHYNPDLTSSMEKLLETAAATGQLQLSGRNLKRFPKHSKKTILKDTIHADLSKNKLNELPEECTDFSSMEKLFLYHNTIRSIPESVVYLQSLQFLDISRNQLSYLPPSICQLPCLQGLIVNNNRLVSLPEEIGRMQSLMELDASCNEIAHLPVQIGDLAALRSLNLRRNHLQEIPIEISYLQLTSLDLSGNRISVLPAELRFMTTVVDLNLGENPLTCPPANLCSRGRIHVFKYLEIQAIKEDRKRGVLTEGEYRRSYRKTGTGQLNDLRFTNGFNGDARRKRHTADSGYGSEQPLDRRWSQEYSQEMIDMHTEDARRIVLRAASNAHHLQPQNNHHHPGPAYQVTNRGSPRVLPTHHGSTPAHFRHSSVIPPPPPVVSGGSNSDSSSGYSSIENNPNHPQHIPPPASSSGNSSTSSYSSPNARAPNLNGLENEFHKMMDGMFASPGQDPMKAGNSPSGVTNHRLANSDCHLPSSSSGADCDSLDTTSRGTSPDDVEKEERRRVAHKVLGKQGQYKEQLRQQRQTSTSVYQARNGIPPSESIHQSYSDSRLCSGKEPGKKPSVISSSRMEMNSSSNSLSVKSNYSSTWSSMSKTISTASSQQIDVKTMQKEAVLSYVKSKQGAGSTGALNSPTRNPPTGDHLRQRNNQLNPSRSSSTSSIPQPMTVNTNGLSNPTIPIPNNRTYAARRDVEKSASPEMHINQLRTHIESRLGITLPEDMSHSLQDGVILCHIANHVKPRAVASIHVPSPAVPKLNAAKCRRNVENFLLACRKIGVREIDLFAWDDLAPEADVLRVLLSLNALLDLVAMVEEVEEPEDTDVDGDPPINFPDLVPRDDQPKPPVPVAALVLNPLTSPLGTPSWRIHLETLGLLSLLTCTMIWLYLYPADEPPFNDLF